MTTFRGFDYIWVLISQLTDACYMSRPYHSPGFGYSTSMKFPVRSPEIICSVTKRRRKKVFASTQRTVMSRKRLDITKQVLNPVVSTSTSYLGNPIFKFRPGDSCSETSVVCCTVTRRPTWICYSQQGLVGFSTTTRPVLGPNKTLLPIGTGILSRIAKPMTSSAKI